MSFDLISAICLSPKSLAPLGLREFTVDFLFLLILLSIIYAICVYIQTNANSTKELCCLHSPKIHCSVVTNPQIMQKT